MPRLSRPASAIKHSDSSFDPLTSTAEARAELPEDDGGEPHYRSSAKSIASASIASLPGWPLQESPAKKKSDRAAVWPPTPSSVQRPSSAFSEADLKPSKSNSIIGRVDPKIRACKSGGPLHSGAGPALSQTFEGHAEAPPPYSFGYIPESAMPPRPPTPPPLDLLGPPPVAQHRPDAVDDDVEVARAKGAGKRVGVQVSLEVKP